MSEPVFDSVAFYIVDENDLTGEGAHGPYSMVEAELILKEDEKIITRQQLAAMRASTPMTAKQKEPAGQAKMQREIRSWGIILFLLGVVSVFANGFANAGWGILLIGVSLASFYFREAPMFVIYGVTISFAAISNFLSGTGGWPAFAFVQVFFAFQTFRQYVQFRATGTADEVLPAQNRSGRIFPWAGFAFGVVSLAGFGGIVVTAILLALMPENEALSAALSFSESLIVDMAILGFALGLASLLSRFQHKVFATIGLAAGLLVLLCEIALSFLE